MNKSTVTIFAMVFALCGIGIGFGVRGITDSNKCVVVKSTFHIIKDSRVSVEVKKTATNTYEISARIK